MKLKQHVSLYITSVLVLTTVLIANNQINKIKAPATTPVVQSQQTLSDTTATKSETAPATTPDTTVKPTVKESTTNTPKTTVETSSTTETVTETPAEPVTVPQLTEEERVYKMANVNVSKISSNSPYTVSLDKTSLPDGSSINVQVNPLERWSASIIVIQALTSSSGMFCANTQGSWLLNPDGKTYSNTYRDNVGISFNGSSKINLYIIIKLKDGTFYQYKYILTKTN